MSAFRYTSGDRPLDGFTIQHALGRGGFGEVYYAQSDAGREVALKVIQNYEDIELRGISHCMNLKSPHLVTIFDVKHDPSGRPWVVMEYVAGPCLKELLDEAATESANGEQPALTRGSGIGADQAMYFMRELITGMRYLHDSGVVHRDLKPHNIFFEDGTVKIGDYSLSKAISTSHRSGHTTTVGSVHYMAPEIGEGKYGKAVDIYALGVILFEMLTGNPPYVGESMGEVLIKHLTSEPNVEGLNPIFGRVITKAMARKPEDRFQSMDEMLHALCPEDHSIYLPAPASLSMIGDRATARRNRKPSGQRSGNNDDTFIKVPGLVDTKENSPSQFNSQPFERPGLKVPQSLRDWLSLAGLWYQAPQGELMKSEGLTCKQRGIVAALVCLSFALFATTTNSFSWTSLIFLTAIFSFASLAFCVALLQLLPRKNSWGWSIVSRIIGAASVLGLGLLACLLLHASGMGRVCDDDHLPALFFGSLIIDWRCFISIGRYPRVGIAKTLATLGVLFLAMMWFHVGVPEKFTFGLTFIAVVTLTIQILAPHRRFGLAQSRPPLENQRSGIESRAFESLETETRYESDSYLLMEKI